MLAAGVANCCTCKCLTVGSLFLQFLALFLLFLAQAALSCSAGFSGGGGSGWLATEVSSVFFALLAFSVPVLLSASIICVCSSGFLLLWCCARGGSSYGKVCIFIVLLERLSLVWRFADHPLDACAGCK